MRRVVIVIALLLVGIETAGATEVSYVDQGQVWVSTLDGTQKRAISGPAPEGRTWTEQAQSDDGWIVGVAREPGKTGAAAPIRVWNPAGAIAVQSTLSYHGAYNNGSLAVPVQLDLAPGGQQMIYTYSDIVYGYPTSSLYQGTWVTNVNNGGGEPFDIPSLIGSSLAGSRWVGVNDNAASDDDNIVVEATGGQGPYSTTFTPWFHATGAWAVDVAADGSLAAVIYQLTGGGPYALGLFAATGIGAPLPGASCDVAAIGSVDAVSVAQDGRSLAWVDDRGLVTAALSPITTSPCPLAGAPTVISATGTHPSLGATTLAIPPSTQNPPAPPGLGTTPAPAPAPAPAPKAPTTPPPSSAKPALTVPKTVKASAFAKGLRIIVRVRRAGTVTATAKSGRTTLAKTTMKARKAGAVTIRLKASKALARRLGRYKGKRLTLTVKAPGGTVTVTRKLR